MNNHKEMQKVKWSFSASSKREWVQKALIELGDKPLEGLITKTEDGILIEPYYVSDDIKSINYLQATNYAKYSLEDSLINFYSLRSEDATQLNGQILHALKSGVNALKISSSNFSETFLKTALNEVVSEIIFFDLEIEAESAEIIRSLTGNVQPIHKGTLSTPIGIAELKELIEWSDDNPDFFPLTFTDSLESKDLSARNAYMISHLAEKIEALVGLGLPLEKGMSKLRFSIRVGLDYFLEAARIRALQKVLDEVIKSYNLLIKPSIIFHIESPAWVDSKYEPHGNMLRGTMSALIAIVSGCNSITIHPVDKDDELQRRIAWNTFQILKEEALMDKVEDPGKGSYYFENITWQFAEKTLDTFKEIESSGGYSVAVKNNSR